VRLGKGLRNGRRGRKEDKHKDKAQEEKAMAEKVGGKRTDAQKTMEDGEIRVRIQTND
jgi:hypothetical protein